MKQSWRWYGPEDPVSLSDIKQAGVSDIVSALHHLPNGIIWSIEEILKRKKSIEDAGLIWSVVESVPVHEDVKKRTGDYRQFIENYKTTIKNLSACQINILCYNFMPVVDWTRTDLKKVMADGSLGLSFDKLAYTAFDVFLLERKGAEDDYSSSEISNAKTYIDQLSQEEKSLLVSNMIAGLPGAEESYIVEKFKKRLEEYDSISSDDLKDNLVKFLKEIVPVAEENQAKMCIHPDDPPFSLFGLPRVVSTAEDIRSLFSAVPSYFNGLTFCTGSFAARRDNNLEQMFVEFAPRIHFVHLRNIRLHEGGFFESDHLSGSVDMAAIMNELINEMTRRKNENLQDSSIPVRPDHGHQMLDDLAKSTNPGYSAIGRLRGLAELRGLELGILHRNKLS